MEGPQSTVSAPSSKRQRWARIDVVERLAGIDSNDERSQREMADELGIPRSTLQYWMERKASLDVDPQLADFMESPCGLAFLHRLILAAHLVFTQVGPCGIRLMCLFLELSHLDRFVASSFGAQQHVSAQMQEAIQTYGQQEASSAVKPNVSQTDHRVSG